MGSPAASAHRFFEIRKSIRRPKQDKREKQRMAFYFSFAGLGD